MQDLISRQAALREYQSVCYGINCDACPFLTEDEDKLCKLELWIHGLPSVQPDIVRCGQCKYAEVADPQDNQDGYTCQFHRGSIWFSGSFCSWGERRTDE